MLKGHFPHPLSLQAWGTGNGDLVLDLLVEDRFQVGN